MRQTKKQREDLEAKENAKRESAYWAEHRATIERTNAKNLSLHQEGVELNEENVELFQKSIRQSFFFNVFTLVALFTIAAVIAFK